MINLAESKKYMLSTLIHPNLTLLKFKFPFIFEILGSTKNYHVNIHPGEINVGHTHFVFVLSVHTQWQENASRHTKNKQTQT